MRRNLLSILLILFLSFVFWYGLAKADVTGSFGVQVLLNAVPCQLLDDLGFAAMPDQPCEKTFLKVDFESTLSINVTISGLTLGLHSHAGVTGFEDIILNFNTTLGAVDIKDTFVFAQAYGIVPMADGDFIPTCYEDALGSGVCLTLFVKKRVEVAIAMGGLTFQDLAIIEDVNFPLPGTAKPAAAIYTQQSQSFGFGDLMTILGQTPSGISVMGQTSFCISDTGSNLIKQHSFAFIVNPDCVGNQTRVKPPVFFDFERISITGIPITSEFTTDLVFRCTGVILCTFVDTFTVSGAAFFSTITGSLSFDNALGPVSFSGVTLRLQASSLTLAFSTSPDLSLTSFSAVATFTLNPDTNPAGLSLSASGSPGTGLSSLIANLRVSRSGMTGFALAVFSGSSGVLNFSVLTLSGTAEVGVFNLEASTSFKLSGFVGASIKASVSF